jgi:hypothetical protein
MINKKARQKIITELEELDNLSGKYQSRPEEFDETILFALQDLAGKVLPLVMQLQSENKKLKKKRLTKLKNK